MELAMQDDDLRVAYDASVVLLHFGFGKPRETLTIEQDVAVVDEYPTLKALRAALIANGIPIDRLEEPKLIDHEFTP